MDQSVTGRVSLAIRKWQESRHSPHSLGVNARWRKHHHLKSQVFTLAPDKSPSATTQPNAPVGRLPPSPREEVSLPACAGQLEHSAASSRSAIFFTVPVWQGQACLLSLSACVYLWSTGQADCFNYTQNTQSCNYSQITSSPTLSSELLGSAIFSPDRTSPTIIQWCSITFLISSHLLMQSSNYNPISPQCSLLT